MGRGHATTHARASSKYSNEAVRKEQKERADAGRALRGATFSRMGTSDTVAHRALAGMQTRHLLGWQCGAPKTLARNTFAS
eukprot:6594689-Pyramimonas_sp.AAC.1